MAFLSDRDGQFDVWVSQIGSGQFVNVSRGRFPLPEAAAVTARWVGFSGDSAQVWFTFPVSSHPPLFDSWLAPSMVDPRPFLKSGMQPAWSPDGSKVAYHTAEPGDPIFIADRTGRDPKQIFNEEPGVHCHFLIWSPDGRFIYFVKGIVATQEMDIWRIRSSGVGPSERLTYTTPGSPTPRGSIPARWSTPPQPRMALGSGCTRSTWSAVSRTE